MPKAGMYNFPHYDLDTSIEKLRQYYTQVRTDESTREVAADALGMVVKGGGFLYVISSMEKYGLIETGQGKIVITSLGKTILFGEPDEIEQAKKSAASNVDLFRDLHNQYGRDVDLEQIRIFLRHKANVDIAKAQKLAPKIDGIYKKVSSYITASKTVAKLEVRPEMPDTSGREMGMPVETQKTAPFKIQQGDLYIQIPSDPSALDSIALAKDALDFMEKRLLKQRQKEESNTSREA